MMKLVIFDPAMCCSTGVCGPGVDPVLTRISFALQSLKNKGYQINRFNLANEPREFTENSTINNLLQEKGIDALPAILLNGKLVKHGEYPSNGELAEWFYLKAEELEEKEPEKKINFTQL
ncbi:arsenite efflux transporter metallochaperone ArsD [Terribacillus saccharophilus]|uniref:arsenite efflux transporter metallochaperone ArsD n=1 Tax=Terribacillus saccharophilus TaxID=361277 RepID=UPI0037F273C4